MTKFSHMSHGEGDHKEGHAVPGNLARDGVAKRVEPVAIHSGMTRKQTDAAGIGGQGHATATINDGGEPIATSAAAAPLAHAYGGAPDLKSGRAAANVPGMRSRTNEDTESHLDKLQNGRDCLDQAVKN